MLLRLIAPIAGNILGLYIAVTYVPGVDFTGTRLMLLVAGLLLGVLHYFIKPLLRLLAFPVILLTGGLFSFIINMGLLWLADALLKELTIDGIVPLLLTTFILSIVHFVI